MAEDAANTAPKRKPGRPKGTARTGGRAKGTPNRKNVVTRDYVIKQGAPLAFLCNVVRGKRFTAAAAAGDSKRVHVFPSLDQRLRAAEVLARKVLPDLKSQELIGNAEAPIIAIQRTIVRAKDPEGRSLPAAPAAPAAPVAKSSPGGATTRKTNHQPPQRWRAGQ